MGARSDSASFARLITLLICAGLLTISAFLPAESRNTIAAIVFGIGVLAMFAIVYRQELAARKKRMMLRRMLRGFCGKCGYDLRASAGNCPECGEPIRWASPRAIATRITEEESRD